MDNVNAMLSEFVDIDSMVSEVEKASTRKFWRPTLPKTTIRILPPIKANGEKLPYFEHKVHWINGQPYECLNQTMVDKDGHMHTAESCPICKMVKTLYAAKTDAATNLAKAISAKTRYVSRIVVRDDKTLNDAPVFYELPFSLYTKFKTAILDKEWGSLVGPMDGRDMDVVKTGEGKYTNYDSSSFKPTTSKIFEDTAHMVEVLQEAKNMSYNSLVSFQDADSIKSVAMENEEIARFFGNSVAPAATYNAPVTAVSTEYVVPNDELIPSAPAVDVAIGGVKEEQATSSADELESLLAGLV